MKRVIATAAILLAALGMTAQVQAHGRDNDRRGWQDQGRQERGWQDNRPSDNNQWRDRDRDRDRGRWNQPRRWHDREQWRDRDDNRWARPWYHEYRYPRYDYRRPYYGYGSRYRYPPAYGRGYYDDYGYYDDCDDSDISLLLSLPLRF